jgi:hypothetical protein
LSDLLTVNAAVCCVVLLRVAVLQTSCAESPEDSESMSKALEGELSVAASLMSVINNHPRFPLLSDEGGEEEEGEGGSWEDETAAGRSLQTYLLLVRAVLRYEEVFVLLSAEREQGGGGGDEEEEEEARRRRGELFCQGSELLQRAAGQVKQLLRAPSAVAEGAGAACVSSMEFLIPQR